MPSTYTTNLGIEKIAPGEQAGTWGTATNVNFDVLEQAISGYATYTFPSDADQTLVITDGGTSNAKNMYLRLAGSLTAARNLNVPPKPKLYFIFNDTGHNVTFKTVAGSGVAVRPGRRVVLACDGVNIVPAITGQTGTATAVAFYDANGDLNFSAGFTFASNLLNVPRIVVTGVTGLDTVIGSVNTHSLRIGDAAGALFAAGYLDIPQVTGTTTLALVHRGKHLNVSSNVTVPANATVAFPVGSAVSVFNDSSAAITIAITSDTLRLAGTTLTGTRTLAGYGFATLVKVGTTTWIISGAGVT